MADSERCSYFVPTTKAAIWSSIDSPEEWGLDITFCSTIPDVILLTILWIEVHNLDLELQLL
jgi:hypothetical protein